MTIGREKMPFRLRVPACVCRYTIHIVRYNNKNDGTTMPERRRRRSVVISFDKHTQTRARVQQYNLILYIYMIIDIMRRGSSDLMKW